MKKIRKILAVLLLLSSAFALTACKKPAIESKTESILLDADVAPPEGFSAAKYDIMEVYNSTDYTPEEKAVTMWQLVCFNEPHSDNYAFFIHTEGDTDISDGSGRMVYQKYHIQSRTQKYEQILKCVPEHSFSGIVAKIADSALQTGKINLVNDGKLYRFVAASTPTYSNETGLITVPWQKGSDWGKEHSMRGSQKEMIKGNINPGCAGIIKTATFESKADEDGNKYLRIVMEVDAEVANNDSETMENLEDANSPATKVQYNYLTITYEVWESGFLKYYRYDESWKGKMFSMEGASESVAECHYSYSARDCDITEKLKLIDQINDAS